MTIPIPSAGSFTINVGQICAGGTFKFKICNTSESTAPWTINSCGCPDISFDSISGNLDSCACVEITGTYTGQGFPNIGDCTILITSGSDTSTVTIRWEEVYCDIATTAWGLKDTNAMIGISNTNFSNDCDIFTQGCMGEAKIHTRHMTVAQPVVPNDELYLSQWLFAQIVNWDYANYPVAGWRYRVCLNGEVEDPTVDGTFDMEWYGEQPSEENSQNSPFVQVVIWGSGTQIEYTVNFNLPEDSLQPPLNQVIDNHRQLLANSVRNQNEINNQSDNSIYRNYKYLSWAFVIYRSVGAVYQDSIFSIRGRLPFYGEDNIPNACIFRYDGIVMTVPSTTQVTDYLSTTRSTSVRVNFNYQSGNPSGTPPDDMWVYLIRNDSRNNQLDFYENYQYEQSDLTNNVASANITPVTAPTNISGDDFYAEFDVSALNPNQEGVENISDSFRFIFVVHSAIDSAARSNVSDAIQVINYSDEDMTIPGGSVVFRTVEQEYTPAQNVLNTLPVNMNLETALRLNLPLSDAEVQAKSGGRILTAQEAFRGASLEIYDQSPLTGQTLLNVEYFNALSERICEGNTDTGNIIDRSVGSNIDLTFPFTIPDNIYRKIGREGLFQSDVTDPNNWEELSMASLSCVQNRQSEQCDVLFRLPDIAPIRAPNAMCYVPDTNEVWVAGEDTAFPAFGMVYAINVTTLAISQLIPTTLTPASSIVYVPNVGVVVGYLSGDVEFYTPTSRALFATVTLTGVTDIIYLPIQNELWVNCPASTEIYRINPNTQAVIGAPLNIFVTAVSLLYVPPLNEVWAYATSVGVLRVDVATFAIVGETILLTNADGFRMLYTSSNNVWCANANEIDVVSISTFAVTNSISVPLQGGYGLIENAGIVYSSDVTSNLVRSFDITSLVALATYASGSINPRQILFTSGLFLIANNVAGLTDSITPYTLNCNDSLPPFTMVNRNILFNWTLQFDFFDNQEFYTFQQKIERPSPSRLADFVNDFVDIDVEEYQNDGTLVAIPSICPTTGVVHVTANLVANKLPFSVGVELQPIRGGTFSSETPTSPISIPSDSPYISNLTPANFVSTNIIEFDLDIPAMPIQGDYELLLHFLLK